MKVPESEVDAFNFVCTTLDFYNSPGFIEESTEQKDLQQEILFKDAKEKLQIDAIYFNKQNDNALLIPMIYFKKMKYINYQEIYGLHLKIWNQGRAPMLFIVTPTEVIIYDCFKRPSVAKDGSLNSMDNLVEKLEIMANLEQITRDFGRWNFDTGEVWLRYDKHFNSTEKVDQLLLENLRKLRCHLTNDHLSIKVANSLIGRSIFVMYLQDRGALVDYFDDFLGGKYRSFVEVLEEIDDTYNLFSHLGSIFGGDIFPISEEEKKLVASKHLKKISDFLKGTDLDTSQSILWPYNFNIIPIEFISSIYEEFLHSSSDGKGEKEAAHYTPSYLVEFLIDQVMPYSTPGSYKILDPSCGSGIFLVGTFRRLIANKKRELGVTNLPVLQLKDLLSENIFGVDINIEAIFVAAFSLYLTMLDYIEPKSLLKHKNLFPKLIGTNLYISDFLDKIVKIEEIGFDLVIGNTPWDSHLTNPAKLFLSQRRKTVGDQQISKVFLLKAMELAKREGKICLITAAKSFLFNIQSNAKIFRKDFFSSSNVETIINLASLRHRLFKKSKGAAAVVIYSPTHVILSDVPEKEENSIDFEDHYITYVCPKPSTFGKKLGSILIEQSDVSQIPLKMAIEDNGIWKNAMWGTSQDWKLVNRLRERTLEQVLKEYGLTSGEGFQPNGSKKLTIWLNDLPFLPDDAIKPFHIRKEKIDRIPYKSFHRLKSNGIYKGPLSIMRTTPQKGDIVSAFYNGDIFFKETIASISGSEDKVPVLKTIVVILNSTLAKYFLFLTASSWGVERDEIKLSEFKQLPFPKKSIFLNLVNDFVRVHDHMSSVSANQSESKNDLYQNENMLDKLVFDAFELGPIERALVKEFTQYELDFFKKKEASKACYPATEQLVISYASVFKNAFETIIKESKREVSATVYVGNKELFVASFILQPLGEGGKISIIRDSEDLNEVLRKLNRTIKREMSRDIFFSRFLKIYESDVVYLVRPSDARLWTTSHAITDLEDVLADVLTAWGGQRIDR